MNTGASWESPIATPFALRAASPAIICMYAHPAAPRFAITLPSATIFAVIRATPRHMRA
jgi:hypothetical protein